MGEGGSPGGGAGRRREERGNESTYFIQDPLDKLMHILSELRDCVPVKNAFYSFRAQTD